MRAIKTVEQTPGEGSVPIDIEEILTQIKKINKNSKFKTIGLDEFSIYDSGNETINYISGCRGIARGKVIQIVGGSSSGKTTLAQLFVASVQKAGKVAAWIDAEDAFVPSYAIKFGVNIKTLIHEKPNTAEEVFDDMIGLLGIPEIGIVVVDSIASLMPEAEQEESKQKAILASFLATKLKLLTNRLTKESPVIILLNQKRKKFNAVSFGEQTQNSGGVSVDYYSQQIYKTARIKKIEDDLGRVIGVKTQVELEKNKLGMPFRKCVLTIDYRKGISRFTGFLDLLLEYKIITKSGMGFSYNGTVYKKDEVETFYEQNKEAIIKALEE